jgi:hypothetical protein
MRVWSPSALPWKTAAGAALVVCLVLPGALLLAARPEARDLPEGDAAEQALARSQGERGARLLLPPLTPPPPEFSPFGRPLPRFLVFGEEARGLLSTKLGEVEWDPAADDIRRSIPPALLLGSGEVESGPRGTLHPGLNYLLVDEDRLRALSAEAVLAEVGEQALILGVLPNATLLVDVRPEHLAGLRRLTGIARTRALEPYQKIDPALGSLPRLSPREAGNPALQAVVTIIPGRDSDALRHRIEAIPGVSELLRYDAENAGYQLRIDYRSVAALARIDEVIGIGPLMDQVLSNAEIVPTVQAGSAEDSTFARPFDAAGVDGGGIDTNGDGMRINDGSDAVPPQIVDVTDNGISFDTPSFSQTLTQTTIFSAPIGPAHRKIHAILNVVDSGTSCDAPLSGGGTHGQVVASVIAAYSSYFGIYATRSGLGGPTAPRSANLDGVAKGARIILQDAGTTAQCTINSLVEKGGNVTPGSLLQRLNSAITSGGNDVHLSVMPFGAPDNFSTNPNPNNGNGTYPQQSADIDTFLYNNRDYMVFLPAGNNGGLIGNNRLGLMLRVIPDLWDGSIFDDDPNYPQPIQIQPPATAKNSVTVGGTSSDCFTLFGGTDCEGVVVNYTSRGPASPESLRMAPIVTAPQFDVLGTPYTSAVAVFKSNDNDNLPPIDAQLDEGNFGTSYAAAAMTGAGALIRDYFAQGFYPSGDRVTADRVPNISGALVKAALVASSDFNEGGIGTQGEHNQTVHNLRRTRCMDLGSVSGVGGSTQVGVMCNSEQGYGRPVLTDVLPLAGWSDEFVLHPVAPNVREYPAAGLLVFDALATGEGLIDNSTFTSRTHTFRLAGAHTIVRSNGGVSLAAAQLRIALAWPDRPSPAASGGPLVNDLDLVLEGPGPDNCLSASDTKPDGSACPATAANDNEFYDGNVYDGGHGNVTTDQWSKVRLAGGTEKHDFRNPSEAIHLSADPNNDLLFDDSPLYLGTWRVTVKRGLGGALPGQITITVPTVAQDPDQDEDDNHNGRLDPGEDNNGNGLLDQPGQPYALVVSGPVILAEAAPPAGPASYPSSLVSWDRVRYECADNAVLSITDSTGAASPSKSQANTIYQVVNAAGVVTDTESGLSFTASGDPFVTRSAGIPIRLAAPAIPGNGILEGDTGSTVVATYAPSGQRAIVARAPMSCDPDLVPGSFSTAQGRAFGPQVSIAGGCDNDEFMDAGETVTYGVALENRSRTDDYGDVTATLTPSGPGAAAIRVLDSPKNIGTFPGNGTNGVFFHVFVDPTTANGLAVANRVFDMTLTLDSVVHGTRLSRQSYTFHHAINSDRETFYYSTDYKTGGREVRDLNRNGIIDPPDLVDRAMGFVLPREDVTFSSLFSGSGAPAGHFTNEQGEDLDLNGVFSGTERNVVPDVDGSGTPILDRGVLASNAPSAADKIPWSFDNSNGGWIPFRHPGSTAANVSVNPLWEYKTAGGLCGFQTSGGFNKFGIWHTGDGDPTTPNGAATACDKYSQPSDPNTPPKAEMLFDVLMSPLVAKVNQAADPRGFPYTVEFQRLGFNLNIQLFDGYAGGGVNIDNNADSDNENSLLGQQLDQYYMRLKGGWPYGLFRFAGQYFGGPGITPVTTSPHQRTFGDFQNPNGVPIFDGDESGYTGCPPPNPNSGCPIPAAIPDYLPYPLSNALLTGVCDGGTQAGQPCDPQQGNGACGGGVCHAEDNTIAGPVRNFDSSLVGYEGGFASILGANPLENWFVHVPGAAGNRWLIGIGFWAIESPTHNTDYGAGIDDVVFEWEEYHPQDEAAMGHAPACSRFGGPSVGQPSGGQCATLTADRTSLYGCNESIEVTLYDAKCASIGAGNTSPLYGFCTTNAQCGAGGVCTAAYPSVQVAVATPSDGVPIAGSGFFAPGAKRFTLAAVPGTPGLYRGTVPFSSLVNDANHVFVSPATDGTFSVYYFDPLCDGDRDGQAGEDDFANLDGDGIPDAADNCPRTYNPGQEDADHDGIGDLCDDCPAVADPTQKDSDADGVGDACEFDDIDGDGIPNLTDNCPDVRNPNQSDIDLNGRGDLCDTLKTSGVTFVGTCSAGTCAAPAGAAGRSCTTNAQCIADCDPATHQCTNNVTFTSPVPKVGATCNVDADCFVDLDRDADGVLDKNDNCVIAPNGPLGGPDNQRDSDGDGLGDVCDGDCVGAHATALCRISGAPCAAGNTVDHANCDANNPMDPSSVCSFYVANSGSCSPVNDDYDADGVSDALDNCPTVSNPPVVAGRTAQADRDHDGLGDACDPTGSFDDGGDGIPDDVVVFNGSIACRTQPLASFAVVGTAYQDFDGDHDEFPDTGETGRVTFTLKNNGPALSGVVFTLTSSDPDVACITSPSVAVASFPAGATLTVGSLDPGQPGFTFTASNSLQTPPPPGPIATIDLSLRMTANEVEGLATPLAASLLADVNLAAGTQAFVLGPDGIAGTADDGQIVETFDNDTDGDGLFTVKDTFRQPIAPGVYRGTCSNAATRYCQTAADCPAGSPAPICQSGAYLRGSDAGTGLNHLAAVVCGGFGGGETSQCVLDPDYPMDWHLHCAPGAANCPNTESSCAGTGCNYNTPPDGAHARSLPNSLHMGAHFFNTAANDTTHFRTLQGFESAPINLALDPGPAGLEMSFFQIARLMDNNGVGPTVAHICVDCGDVQVQVDSNPDPQIDAWGFWEKLVPYQNVYDHKPLAFSIFGSYYCVFTPTDTGTAPPAPYGFTETLCYPQGAWSHCGSTTGTTTSNVGNCTTAGVLDAYGTGVWAQTKFHLDAFRGQRIRIRWIGETWNFGAGAESYYELGAGWNTSKYDDGWWIDDIVITGATQQQVTPVPDTTPRTGSCPSDACNGAVGDAGTAPAVAVTDANGNLVDGSTFVPARGQTLRLDGSGSTLPGGCSNGTTEYRFERNGAVAQDWSGSPFFSDAPDATTRYRLLVRCSADHACTSVAGAVRDIGVLSGEGGEFALGAWGSGAFDPTTGVTYDRVARSTTLRWWSPGTSAADLYRGLVGPGISRGVYEPPIWRLQTSGVAGSEAACVLNGVAGTPETAPPLGPGGSRGTSGALTQATDPDPALGFGIYYLVGSDGNGAGPNALGCPAPGVCNHPGWCELGTNPGLPCTTSADCPGGGTCTPETTLCGRDSGGADLSPGGASTGGCALHVTCGGGTRAGRLCSSLTSAADCPGGSCGLPAGFTGSVMTPGSFCLTPNGPPLAPGGVPVECPATGNPRRTVRLAPAANVCP